MTRSAERRFYTGITLAITAAVLLGFSRAFFLRPEGARACGRRPAADDTLPTCALALACLAVAVVAFMQPSAAFAQCPEKSASRPLFLTGGRLDVPLREAGSVGLLIPLWPLDHGEFGCSVAGYRGLLAEASVGIGGRRLAAGLARRVKQDGQPALFGEDVLVSVIQTTSLPRGASPDSTHLGVEVGLTLVAIRFSAGVAHRLGPGERRPTMFIWSIGPQIAW